jgi:hypothetical protein
VSQWFDRLSLDDQEGVHTVVYVYSTPGYGGEEAAVTYAALLPAAPPTPEPGAQDLGPRLTMPRWRGWAARKAPPGKGGAS